MAAAAAEETSALARLGSATIGESGGQAMAARIGPAWPGAAVAGPAYPVSCVPGDNLAIHAAVAAAPAESVLVVDVGATPDRGYFGEVLATGAQARGLAGLVIDGCVRDVAALQRVDFPVFARGTALPGAAKAGGGAIAAAAVVGGVRVELGDWVVGDVDGVAVVPAGALGDVLARGQARETKERTMFERLQAGATTVELLGLDVSAVSVGPPGRIVPPGVVQDAEAPVPSGGYSQARWAGDTLYLAGVGPYHPVTREIVGTDISTQTERTVANAAATLTAAGLSLRDVVSTGAFLADLHRDWRGFDAAYARLLPAPYPARAMVGAQLKGILVELVMVAHARR